MEIWGPYSLDHSNHIIKICRVLYLKRMHLLCVYYTSISNVSISRHVKITMYLKPENTLCDYPGKYKLLVFNDIHVLNEEPWQRNKNHRPLALVVLNKLHAPSKWYCFWLCNVISKQSNSGQSILVEEICNVGYIRNPSGWACLEKQMEFVGDSQVHVIFLCTLFGRLLRSRLK